MTLMTASQLQQCLSSTKEERVASSHTVRILNIQTPVSFEVITLIFD
jgi:hypothetical protein